MKRRRGILWLAVAGLLLGLSVIVWSQTVVIFANLSGQLTVDVNRNGLVDNQDEMLYTLVVANCGTETARGVNFKTALERFLSFLPDSVVFIGLRDTTRANCATPPSSETPSTETPPPPPIVNPTVTSTSPADADTEVALDTNITITFSEPVSFGVVGDWVEMVCTTSGTFNETSANLAISGGPTVFFLDPGINLAVGETCTVTVFASQVRDADSNFMLADETFSFTLETPPTITNTAPLNGATTVLNTSDIVLTFDEPVTVSAASFTLECPVGVPFAGGFAVSGTGTNVITINPTGNLPSGTSCEVVAVAANISDVDANDPPDLLDGNNDNIEGDNYTFSFTTDVDAAPTVQTITPSDLAVSIPTNTTIEITFSESVDIASAAAFSLECPAGVPQGFTVTTPAVLPASATTFILTPPVLLPADTACSVTVFAAAVEDTDLDEPPNNMVADFTSTFTTEAPPSVTGTSPANGDINISTGTNVVLTFNEPVDVDGPSFSMFCGVTPIITSNSGTGTNTITLDPVINLPTNETCTVTIVAAQVTDTDLIDPPDNMVADYVFSFTTLIDTAPTVTTTNPANADTGVLTSSNIVITFSEPVDVVNTPTPAFTLECPVGNPIAFNVIPALPTLNQTSFTLDPISNLPATTTCTVTVEADNVEDTDLDEPPNNMAADYSFTFDTLVDLAPTVVQASIVPASTSTGLNSASLTNVVSTTPTITIPFSEAIDAASVAFTLSCPGAVGVNVTPGLPTTNQTSFDVSPSSPLTPGVNCTLTVVAANINDTDVDDPPNLMVADYTVTFSVDTAPAQVPPFAQTEVNNTFENIGGTGANNVDLDSDIRIMFDEAVTVTFPTNGLQCPAGNNIPVTVTTNNAATIVLNPGSNLPLNTACVLNIPAANISDVDTADAPDNPTAAVSHAFTTADDDAPTVTTNPANGAGNLATNANITVTFNEAVTLTGSWFNLNCSISGTRTSTGELTGTGITIIENTPDLVYTIDPTLNFADGDICTITIDSANVVDNDLIDPPNELDGDASLDVVDGDADDYVATFSTSDVAPRVTTTTPITTATVGAGQVVTLNFSEPVDIAPGAFTFECPLGSPITDGFNTSVALPANAVTTINLTPVNPLPFGAACVVTAESTLITDDDSVDPPNQLDGDSSLDVVDGDSDDFILDFTVDAQPTIFIAQVEVAGVPSPIAGAVNVDLDTNIVITFSEPVNANITSFDLECPATTDIAFTVSGSGSNTIIIDPTPATLPINTLCDFDIIAANITDVDTNDAPDTLGANANFTFTTVNDNPPSVATAAAQVATVFTSLPLGVGVYADTTTDLRVTFDEAVTVAGNWAELNCTTSGIQNVSGGLAVTDADPVFTLNPGTNLTAGETCTLTVFAAQVTDDDVIDPPNTMTADAVYTFTVLDTPPQVNTGTSSPANGATVPNNQTVTINFTEMVDIAAGGITFECNATPVAFTPALPQNNVTGIVLTPSSALPNGAACTVTLVSTLITDEDTVDGADDLDGQAPFGDITNGDADNFVLNFTVDAQPTIASAEAEVSNVFTALPFTPPTYADVDTNLQITFDEAVNLTGNWASLTCGVSGTQSVGGGTLAVTDADPVFTLNPNTNLTEGEACTLTIFAAQVNDDDAIDPPANLPADAVYTFTVVDTAPRILSPTTPIATDTVPNNQAVTINFSEIVDVAVGGITWQCGVTSIPFTPALPQNNITTITLTPTGPLPAGSCTVTLESTLITDDDAVDPPNQLDGNNSLDTIDGDADDFTLTFTVDAPPAPLSVNVDVGGVPRFLPLVMGQLVDVGSDLRIVFTEPIDATATGITLECPAGSPVAFAGLPLTNTTNFTLNPSANMPGGTLCRLILDHTGITDTDAFDPPNQLDGNGDGVEGDSLGFIFTTQPQAIDDAYTVTPHLTYVSSAAGLSVRNNDQSPTVTITGFGPTLGTANGTTPNGTNFITAGGAGGRVILNADGTFLFYPDASDDNTDGTVTFFYTITGGDTAQVTLTFEAEELVWFADQFPPGSAVCTGTNIGTQACPATDFVSLIAPNLTASDILFINTGAYQCGITLPNNVQVIGNGSTSTLTALAAAHSSPITPVAGSDFAPYNALNGTAPTLNTSTADCFALGQNNTIRGLTIANTNNFAGIVGTNYGTLTTIEITDNGNGQAIILDTGTADVEYASISSNSADVTAAVIQVVNSTITGFDVTGGVTITNSQAEGIVLRDNTGGTFNFGNTSITKTSNGQGVVLGDGTAQTSNVTFNTLTVSTTNGTAVETNGQAGTVTVTTAAGSNLTATGGAALSVNNTVGTTPINLNLNNVSVTNSPVNGILLNRTGGAGVAIAGTLTISGGGLANHAGLYVTNATSTNFTVTGTTQIVGIDSNGALAQGYGIYAQDSSTNLSFSTLNINTISRNTTELNDPNDFPTNNGDGDAIFLTNYTGTLSATGGTLSAFADDGIDARNSSNITLSGVTITGTNSTFDNTNGVQLINANGTTTLTNVTVSEFGGSSTSALVKLRKNNTGSPTITISGGTYTGTTAGTESTGIDVYTDGSNGSTLNVNNTTIQRTMVYGFKLQYNSSGTHTVNVGNTAGNTFQTPLAGGSVQLDLMTGGASASTVIFDIANNVFSDVTDGIAPAINMSFNGGAVANNISNRIANNSLAMGPTGGAGIDLYVNDTASVRTEVTGNIINAPNDNAMRGTIDSAAAASARLSIDMANNNMGTTFPGVSSVFMLNGSSGILRFRSQNDTYSNNYAGTGAVNATLRGRNIGTGRMDFIVLGSPSITNTGTSTGINVQQTIAIGTFCADIRNNNLSTDLLVVNQVQPSLSYHESGNTFGGAVTTTGSPTVIAPGLCIAP